MACSPQVLQCRARVDELRNKLRTLMIRDARRFVRGRPRCSNRRFDELTLALSDAMAEELGEEIADRWNDLILSGLPPSHPGWRTRL